MSNAVDLDRYAEGLGDLSMDVQTKLAQLHDLNNKTYLLMKHADQLIDEYLKGDFPSEAKKKEKRAYIDKLFARAKVYSDDKIILSNETYNLVDKNMHRLDFYLKRFVNEIKIRANIIRNAPDHHSEERRLERDKKEAEKRERQKANDKKRKAKKAKNKQRNERGDDEAYAISSTDKTEKIYRTDTSEDNGGAIDNQLINIHIIDSQLNDTSRTRRDDDLKSKAQSSHRSYKSSEKKSSSSHERKSSNGYNSSSKKPRSDHSYANPDRSSKQSKEKKSNDSHNLKSKKSRSDHRDTNFSDSSKHSDQSKLSNSKSDKARTTSKPAIVKSSSSSSINHRKIISNHDNSERKVSSSDHVKSSSNSSRDKRSIQDDSTSSKRNSIGENVKDTVKRKTDEKGTYSEEEHGKGAIKKRKVSLSSDSDEFNFPPEPDEPIYCFCRKVSYGDMVACDDVNCRFAWFHFGCVGLRRTPPGMWYCKECAKKNIHNIKKDDR